MYDIVMIESFSVDTQGNLIVKAILEKANACTVGASHLEVPDYAPINATATIFPESLPVGTEFEGKTEEELEELVNRYNLLLCADWF